MKISLSNPAALPDRVHAADGASPVVNRSARRLESQQGVAVIVMLALLSIMLLFIAAGSHSLYRLHRQLQLTEQRQVRRLHELSMTNLAILRSQEAVTNSAPSSILSPTTSIAQPSSPNK